mgnify:CR=1 FL=1
MKKLSLILAVASLVAATTAGQSYLLETGGGYDKVYLGTTPGAETTGSGVKSRIKQVRPGFSESEYGFAQWRGFLRQAGLVEQFVAFEHPLFVPGRAVQGEEQARPAHPLGVAVG